MKIPSTIIALCLILVACATTPSHFIDVTIAAPVSPLTTFTAQIELLSPNGDSVTVYVESIQQTFLDSGGRPSMSLLGNTCSVISSGDTGKCYGDDAKLLLDTLPIKSINSGCWRSTKQNQDYSAPVPC